MIVFKVFSILFLKWRFFHDIRIHELSITLVHYSLLHVCSQIRYTLRHTVKLVAVIVS